MSLPAYFVEMTPEVGAILLVNLALSVLTEQSYIGQSKASVQHKDQISASMY